MCLNTLKFKLEYDPNGHAYVGYGYKKLPEHKINQYKKWTEATGKKNGTDGKLSRSTISTSDYNHLYHPGFHIFLNKEDAVNYRLGSGDVVKVKFKEVLVFGSNETKYNKYGPCVVSRYMKIIERFDMKTQTWKKVR